MAGGGRQVRSRETWEENTLCGKARRVTLQSSGRKNCWPKTTVLMLANALKLFLGDECAGDPVRLVPTAPA